MSRPAGVAVSWREDHECGPVSEFIGVRIDKPLLAAVRTRALAEGVDQALIWRRWCRLGAIAQGVDPYAL